MPIRKGTLNDLTVKWAKQVEQLRANPGAMQQDTSPEARIQYAKAAAILQCIRDLEKAADLKPITFWVGF